MPHTEPPSDSQPIRSLRVPAELAGTRLDRALALLCPDVSRTRLKSAIGKGGVRVDGLTAARPGSPVTAGAVLEVDLALLVPEVREMESDQAFEVLFEDEHLAVVVKPAGMLVHPTPRLRGGTLSELAVARWGPLPSPQGVDRPGIVHRLDAGTSGVLLLCKSEAACAELLRQFREREVEKTYLAVVWGDPRFDTGWIEVPIARSPSVPNRMEAAAPGEGRPSTTYYEVRERFGCAALLACFPRTGRTHQIRVHLAGLGHPLIGDALYRARGAPSKPLPSGAPLPERQALHAAALAFRHPVTGVPMAFEAPLPADIADLLESLRR
jgi:23S rRNA pseudouridine1911/1915/1917 synthase